MWARYKGAIFSKILALHGSFELDVAFIHVAETSDGRGIFGPPDLSYHSYPYELLFKGSSDHIPAYKLAIALVRDIIRNQSELVVIPGYHRFEYWAMLAPAWLSGASELYFAIQPLTTTPKPASKKSRSRSFFTIVTEFSATEHAARNTSKAMGSTLG
jgi:hypothetical protein